MNQSTLDPNLPPEGSPSEPSSARQGSATHRRRRSAARKTQPPRPEQATAAAPALAPEAEPIAAPIVEPSAPASPEEVAAAQADNTPPTVAEQTRQRPAGRSRRRIAPGRKNGVQLVIPPSAEGEATAETAIPPAAESETATPTAPTADVRVEPAAAVPAEPATPLTSEPTIAEPAAAEASPAETAAPAEIPAAESEAPATLGPAPRRYRFDRKATAAPYAPASRPERLSGAITTPATPAPMPPTEAGEEGPAFSSTGFAPGESAEETAIHDAIDDIVSALGLRDATLPREPLRLPVEGVAPEIETTEPIAETQAEETAETETETETEAAADTATTGAARRPRRRRRRGGSHAASAGEEDAEEMLAAEPLAEPAPAPAPSSSTRVREPHRPGTPTPIGEPEHAGRNGYDQYTTSEYTPDYESPYAPYGQAERQPWDVSQGQTQIGHPESPFGSPTPNVVRGFGPQPRGVAGPARENFARTGRTERTDVPPMSSNQLANMVTHAIQQQTDRLLNELRYHPQSPGMTVMFPAFPSTERVGVFVDVANLLYSSRNLHINIDFGKLLEFLRGNRRMIRAHAYAPTNPDPRADQSFLDAVKGLGYRITTKNYKTFASGAKKADMDLDLCMDIVRMVDAGAVDSIVLVSGDSDFLPLLEYCSDHGVRVEVAAFEDAAAAILRQSCDLFINLSLVHDIRM